jgi:hypothetical protein
MAAWTGRAFSRTAFGRHCGKTLMGTGKAFIAAYYIIYYISKLIPIFAYFYIISSTTTYNPWAIPEPFFSTTSAS